MANASLRAVWDALLPREGPYLALRRHAMDAVVYFMVFTACSWCGCYMLGRQLEKRSMPGKAERRLRVKCGHMVASLVHSMGAFGWSLWLFVGTPLPEDAMVRAFGTHEPTIKLMTFSLAYFMWDLLACIDSFDLYGWPFLIHAMSGLMSLTSSFYPFMLQLYSRYLMFEASTIFIDGHWFLSKLGYEGSRLIFVNDLCTLFAYVAFRVVMSGYLSCLFVRDLYLIWPEADVPTIPLVVGSVSIVTSHVLNMMWFSRLIRAAARKHLRVK